MAIFFGIICSTSVIFLYKTNKSFSQSLSLRNFSNEISISLKQSKFDSLINRTRWRREIVISKISENAMRKAYSHISRDGVAAREEIKEIFKNNSSVIFTYSDYIEAINITNNLLFKISEESVSIGPEQKNLVKVIHYTGATYEMYDMEK
ncbi:MAG: hypothetical protein NTV80_08320 [Verrucomicrobia bacterium]|nr:hypothetical protein [Verrucomicrobiota bacterium]